MVKVGNFLPTDSTGKLLSWCQCTCFYQVPSPPARPGNNTLGDCFGELKILRETNEKESMERMFRPGIGQSEHAACSLTVPRSIHTNGTWAWHHSTWGAAPAICPAGQMSCFLVPGGVPMTSEPCVFRDIACPVDSTYCLET